MKKPTVLPTIEGTERHLSLLTIAALIIIGAICILILLSPGSN